jgi:glycosyltransferase involved in cell wall biosynthesis
MQTVVLCCQGVPRNGGINTSTYDLYERLQADGLAVGLINLIEEQDRDFYRFLYGESYGNPKALAEVYNHTLTDPPFALQPILAGIVDTLSPDLIVAMDFVSALALKRTTPERPLIFLTTDCATAAGFVHSGYLSGAGELKDALRRGRRIPSWRHADEAEAVSLADLVVARTDLTRHVFTGLFPRQSGKIFPEVIWSADLVYESALAYRHLSRPFHDRDNAVLFIAGCWERKSKNYDLVGRVAACLPHLEVHLAGETAQDLAGVHHHGVLTKREDLFRLMGRSKSIVCTSSFDPAPAELFEAAAMGCNVIASKNCGTWELCHQDLLVDPYSLEGFVDSIERSLTEEFGPNIEYFLRQRSYEGLKELVDVFRTLDW